MEELKTCPFCGGKMQITTSKCITPDGPKAGYHGYCTECKAHTQTRFSKVEAIADVNRRAEPENKAVTVFSAITESPEKLAKFFELIICEKIQMDKYFCKGDCGGEDCPHELQCIINWLNQPYARKPEGSEKP